jgi:hypothetical protein
VCRLASTTLEALTWALARPLSPRQPEVARTVYAQTEHTLTLIATRRIARLFGARRPPRRLAVVTPRQHLPSTVASVLAYGALERQPTREH